jgi:hypothetical protein
MRGKLESKTNIMICIIIWRKRVEIIKHKKRHTPKRMPIYEVK